MKSYIERYGQMINSVSSTLKTPPTWSTETFSKIITAMDARVPLDKLQVSLVGLLKFIGSIYNLSCLENVKAPLYKCTTINQFTIIVK